MSATTKSRRPLSLRELAGIYQLGRSALSRLERRGADLLDPSSVCAAMTRGERCFTSGGAYYRLFDDPEAPLRYACAIVAALRERGLNAPDFVGYAEW